MSSDSELKLLSNRLVSLELNSFSDFTSGPIQLTQSNISVASTVLKSQRKIKIEISFDAVAEVNSVKLFEIKAKFEGVFEHSEKVDSANINQFSQLNGPAIIYPYVRAGIAGFTISAGFPPLTLPIINFQKVKVNLVEVP